MAILSRRRQPRNSDTPVIARRTWDWVQGHAETRRALARLHNALGAVKISVPYLTGREWVDLGIISGRQFDFSSVRVARLYSPQHPWRWHLRDHAQREAAERLRLGGIVAPSPAEPDIAVLTAEGFLRALHGSWGDDEMSLVALKRSSD